MPDITMLPRAETLLGPVDMASLYIQPLVGSYSIPTSSVFNHVVVNSKAQPVWSTAWVSKDIAQAQPTWQCLAKEKTIAHQSDSI
jgi:hypothetical protein